jgi:hypothetical protein
VITGITIFLGAFLLFQLQPMIAKLILPWFGGSAAVWTACMLFFQTALLAGYAYAHWIGRRTSRLANLLHMALLGASLFLLPVIPSAGWKPLGDANPLPRILGLLAATVGVPYTLLSATSPLLQAWYSRRNGGKIPYRFFALSNLASLLALISYPVLIEPAIPATAQAIAWSLEYAVFVALATFAGWRAHGKGSFVAQDIETPAHAAISWKQRATWIALAACASLLLLATTNHLCQNIAVVPFLWVLPLTAYLLSFILCFDRDHWYKRKAILPFHAAFLALSAYLVLKEVPGDAVFLHIVVYTLGLFVVCVCCHGELARRKPESAHLTQFYLSISVGGALGSVAAGVIAPIILKGVFEFPLSLAACGLLTLLLEYRQNGRYTWVSDIAWAALAIWLVVVARAEMTTTAAGTRLMERSFYGSVRVLEPNSTPPQRTLIHGVIAHGTQLLDPALRREPTSYYARTGGVGLAIGGMDGRPRKIGVIGLGAGTMAAYGRPGDEICYYELDPMVIRVAQNEFTFLSDSPAKVETVAGDGRLALERESERRFDLLAIDAFSGDSIPVHLLSREAFELYFRRLAPDGILAVHVSNSFLDLTPVVGRAAQALGKQARVVSSSEDQKRYRAASVWVLLASEAATLDRIAQGANWPSPPAPNNLRLWTDDYSNLFQILKR